MNKTINHLKEKTEHKINVNELTKERFKYLIQDDELNCFYNILKLVANKYCYGIDFSGAVKSLIEIKQPEILSRILEQNNSMATPIRSLNEETIILFWETLNAKNNI